MNNKQMKMEAILFDLDGVVVFTDKYHYLAWKELSDENGWFFSEEINHGCRGVPRMESLEVILRHNQVELASEQKVAFADRKNQRYVELLQNIDHDDVYPGVVSFLQSLRKKGLKIGLCSSSRNARLVLENLNLTHWFDAIVTGDEIARAKPDPEIFLTGASRLGVDPGACMVFEDAPAGVDAALAAGMRCIGVGSPELLSNAPVTIKDYSEIDLETLCGSADETLTEEHLGTDWTLEAKCFDPDGIVLNGNKYLLGNGAMGYRGTLEEFGAQHLVGNMITGLYDKVGESWREPVNAPNALFAQVIYKGARLSVLESEVHSHRQALDIRRASHSRQTVFVTADGNRITLAAERFISLANRNLMAMEISVCCNQAATLEIETGIDTGIWDINGPHLQAFRIQHEHGILSAESTTHELGIPVCVAETVVCDGFETLESPAAHDSLRRLVFSAEPGRLYRFWKFAAVYTGNDNLRVLDAARTACAAAREEGYAVLRAAHEAEWERYWQDADVRIEGDPEAQFALRYSIYHLLAIAPAPGSNLSIPARGLSGQVYKGAIFWDTEMFMLPFFLSATPAIARDLLLYRYRTLEGARRKAREYGFEGAFYAWESQETGDDACTEFNVTDVFTGRPMRTYFRDKQIHISAAVAHSFWQYYTHTGDWRILLEGGAEVILECARFFYSYSHYKLPKRRFELLDVTGPDEYHERVNNNAYTNRMVLETFKIALKIIEFLEAEHADLMRPLLERLNFADIRAALPRLIEELYVPVPDQESGLIPQFDGYEALENVSLPTLKSRVLNPAEYFGGGNGLATTTQILKQADVVLMMSLFGDDYSQELKKRNWHYYEPRTEHGSSLSACAYAIVASEIGEAERAYAFFLQTATIDLTGKSKQYVGPLYIGGTHPAANGAAWMVTVRGFAGLKVKGGRLSLDPRLPKQWESLCFGMHWQGMRFTISIRPGEARIEACPENATEAVWDVCGQLHRCAPGQAVVCTTGSMPEPAALQLN